jgi:hypothetical protein
MASSKTFRGVELAQGVVAGLGSGVASRAWWNTRLFIVVAVLLAALPLLWPPIPPLLDLPSHMGSYHFALSLDSSASLQKYYDFHWELLGNLGVDLLVMPLAKLFGVELATKIVVVLIPALTVTGMIWVAWEIHGELPPTLGFALPLAYCYPLHFGFVNYCLSMALMLLGLGLWLRLARLDRLALRAGVFAVLAVALWIAHAIGWALLVIACGCVELARRIEAGEPWRRALGRSALACLPLCTPLLIMLSLPHRKAAGATGWLVPQELVKWLVTLFRDRWMAYDLAMTAIFFAVLALAALRQGGMRLRPRLAFAALALFLTFLAAPRSIDGSHFVNGRIAPYALALFAVAIGTREASARQRHRLAIAASAFLVLRTATTTASMALYSASYTANLTALDHIEPGTAIVALASVPCGPESAHWWNPRLYHLAGMAIVRKDAFVNTEWQVDGLHALRTKYPAAKAFDRDPSEMVTLGCERRPLAQYKTSLETFPRAAFDYLWLLGIPREFWPAEPDLTLVWSRDDSALFSIAH